MNYELYAPELSGKFPFLDVFLQKYQERAAKEGVDPLGFYLPPYAYAMMQVLEQAITATKEPRSGASSPSTCTRHTFDTFVGKVGFAKNGEWAEPRVMMVQYRGIKGNAIDQWKQPG